MQVSRRVRAGGTLGRLLLVAVLALGVFAMHSTGHPGESTHTMSTVSHTTATSHTRATPDTRTTGAEPRSSHAPAPTMDTQSLCVAILLGTWVLTALLKSAFTRRHEEGADLLVRAATTARPRPPPRGPDLTRLSVLRL